MRLRWINRFGLQAIGDLVIPDPSRPSKPYPLVVVQYDTRGFLRGGTGDEYPIQALAASGFAVLSVSRPLDYATSIARSCCTRSDERRVLNDVSVCSHLGGRSRLKTILQHHYP